MRIAIVEDERKLARTLKEGIEAEGHAVDVYVDGAAAIAGVQRDAEGYDLLVLDLMLPRKDGFEVCRTLRQEGALLPIIVLTARDTLEDKVRSLDSGADDFLAKPFEFEELMARIRAVMRRTQLRPAHDLVAGVLAADLRTRVATRSGVPLPLTPTEFDLLAFLIEKAGKPSTREEISVRLWGIKDTSLSNIVDVHLSNLRKKVDDIHAEKLIRTIRGQGYCIEG